MIQPSRNVVYPETERGLVDLKTLVASIVFLICLAPAQEAAITSNATGNWSSTGTWTGGVPGTADTVLISNTDVVTIDDTRVVDSQVVTDGTSSEIIISFGADLTVNGNVNYFLSGGLEAAM